MKSFLAITAAMLLSAQFAGAQTWNLVWSDEFNGPAGSAPSAANWNYDTGGGGFGNGELQVYCAPGSNAAPCNSAATNIAMDGNGNLMIRAILTPGGTWTSGRMKTQGLQQFQFGRMEARIKLPVGAGLWPAFWMLGANIGSIGWPTCGEQDIMEWVPQYTPTTTSSTIHGPGYSGGNGIGARFTFPNGGRVDDGGFHTYGVIWSQDKLQFYRDDWTKPFFTVTPANLPAGKQWVYNNPFFLLLNLAVGGGFPGPPNGSTPSPAVMLVDYVRVYHASAGSSINAGGAAASPFSADADFSGGTASIHAIAVDTSGVSNPAPAAVYQSMRFGNFTYTLPGFTPGSNHAVRLHFAETFWTAPGQRLFNVKINGAQVLTNFDIVAAAGATHKAVAEQFSASADQNGQIAIQFITVKDNAAVSGIEIQ